MQALLPLLLTFVLMWLLLIRPQQRRMRQHQALVASLEPGDEVVTTGGIIGTVVAVEGDRLLVSVAPGVEVRVLRAAVGQRAPEPMDEDDEGDDEAYDDDEGYDDEDEVYDGEEGDGPAGGARAGEADDGR